MRGRGIGRRSGRRGSAAGLGHRLADDLACIGGLLLGRGMRDEHRVAADEQCLRGTANVSRQARADDHAVGTAADQATAQNARKISTSQKFPTSPITSSAAPLMSTPEISNDVRR